MEMKNMENFIKYVNVHNFKSIADLKLEDCRRINLFIGYPNVGKSNVLEALSLFSVAYLDHGDSLNKLVRVKNKNELFYDLQDTQCEIETNLIRAIFLVENTRDLAIRFESDIDEPVNGVQILIPTVFGEDFKLKQNATRFWEKLQKESCGIKRYTFAQNNEWKSANYNFLLPPYGENIVSVLSQELLPEEKEVNKWIENELKKNNLEYVLDFSDNTIKSQKRFGAGRVRSLPYSSFADTLQRLIFYKTAIASNKNSVLLFEEPEAHAFPPYIDTMMYDIIKAKTNQFFIVTHSPLVVNAFLEYKESREETSIYVFDYKNDQTTAKRLSNEEIELAYEYGNSLFFNLENLLVDGH
jgi:AAA15 family ATPase/GTPase